MPRGRTQNFRGAVGGLLNFMNTAMLLGTCDRDGIGKTALKLERIVVVQASLVWRGALQPYSFGVPPTPMTGSHNSQRASLPTPGQRPRTSAWRRRRFSKPSTLSARLPCRVSVVTITTVSVAPSPLAEKNKEWLEIRSSSAFWAAARTLTSPPSNASDCR